MESHKISRASLILMLGSLTALSPFAIDMYLSAFPQMALHLNTTVGQVSLSLSGYFVGLAAGQLFYGPLLDRFGRKRPLYVGMLVFILASIGCALSKTVDMLIVMRFIQAIGGCSAGVASFAMVRDLFEPRESAKVLSLLILILGASPLLAPTIGGFLTITWGWESVFIVLAVMATLILSVVALYLPESHKSDPSHVLKPGPIVRNYLSIIKDPQFSTYAVSGAVAFSALFGYLAASPSIFMEIFGVSEQVYGWIFAIVAAGLIGTSQLNVVLLKKYSNQKILLYSLASMTGVAIVFFICALNGWYNVYSVVFTMFLLLSCIGLSNPNSAALAMAPFGQKAGSAAALLGFLQMSIGAMASVCVGVLKLQQLFPIACLFFATSVLGFLIFLYGSKKLGKNISVADADSAVVSH